MGKGAQIPNPKIQTPNKLQASNSNGGKERGQPCPRVHGKAKRVDIWCGWGRLWHTNRGRRMKTPNSNQRSTFNRGHGPWDGRACVAAPPHIWERAAVRPYRSNTPTERGQPCPRDHGRTRGMGIWRWRGILWQANGDKRMDEGKLQWRNGTTGPGAKRSAGKREATG